jgi:hypothetical protein
MFDQDGVIIFWILAIVIIYNIYLKIKKEHSKSEMLTKLILILGLWGTFYLIDLSVLQVGDPSIPYERKLFELSWRTLSSLGSFSFSVLGWFIVNTIDFFLPKD